MTKLLEGKRGLIMGVANKMSIAWGIAEKFAEAGAEMAFSYQGEALKRRVEPLAASIGVDTLVECDVTDDDSLDDLFKILEDKWGQIDFVVHAIGFSDKNELQGRYVDTSRDNFKLTMDVSVYSFTAVAERAAKLMPEGGSMLTLSYFGAEKVMPNYNVMGVAKSALECSVRYLAHDLGRDGIRVNCISAGPIRTLAASGISGFRAMLDWNELNSPLKRNVTQEDVAGASLFLTSGLGGGVTGELLYVDGGYSKMGMIDMDKTKEIATLVEKM
ncbi:MAG: enoyl-ACP reductase FabI [Alphaproteobacteria bacterium]